LKKIRKENKGTLPFTLINTLFGSTLRSILKRPSCQFLQFFNKSARTTWQPFVGITSQNTDFFQYHPFLPTRQTNQQFALTGIVRRLFDSKIHFLAGGSVLLRWTMDIVRTSSLFQP